MDMLDPEAYLICRNILPSAKIRGWADYSNKSAFAGPTMNANFEVILASFSNFRLTAA